jgi:hypothetical protein
MKNKYFTLLRIILLIILFSMVPVGFAACKKTPRSTIPAIPSTTPVEKVTESPLTVLSITGGDILILKTGEKEWIRGEAGMTLSAGSKVKTQTNGHATLTFFEGSVIELEGETEINLAELGMSGTTTTIKLKQTVGETLSRVKKLADPASRYEIETPAAVMSVRGTTTFVGVARIGTTFIGNIDGTLVVIAQGIETPVSSGNHVTVNPGEPPGKQEPGATPAATATPVPTSQPPVPTTTAAPTTQATTIPPLPVISVSSALNLQKVFNGDKVTITFTVGNTGTVPVSGIIVNDDKAGLANYISGDSNKDSILNPNETWIFKVDYTIPASVSGVLVTTATASGKGPDNKVVNKTVLTQITVTTLMIQITSPNANSVVKEVITLAGIVNDTSISEVMVNHNGVISRVSAPNGSFSTTITLMSGANKIIVTATRPGGANAVATIDLEPVDTPR